MRKVDTSMKILVRSLVRWSWLLIICVVVGFILGKVLAGALPPTYQSTAVVQLNAETRSSQSQIIQPISAYSTNITSDSVLVPVLQKYPQIDRQTFTTKELVVTTDTPSQSVQIQVTLPDRKIAADVANKLAQLMVTQQNAYITAQYTKQLQLSNQRIANDEKAINDLNQRYASTPSTNTALLQQLTDQINQERTIENNDISNQRQLQTEQSLYGTPLSIIQSAQPATKVSSILGAIPFTPLMIALLLLVGVVTIGFIEQGLGRVTDAHALQKKVGTPVLGAIRWIRPVPRDLRNLNIPYAEDCRMMMADVLFHAEEAKAHIICLIGMRPEAGTSSLAAHLAILLAQSKRRVLLIDANLYQPHIHELAAIPNEAGLALMLEKVREQTKVPILGMKGHITNHINVEQFIRPTSIGNLFILPAGQSKMNPGDLLSMPEMGEILKWVTNSVDFVIVDCPALSHSVAHVLGSLGDQTLLVVDAAKDRVKQVVNIKHELANTGVKLSGLLVNKQGRWI